MLSLSFIQKLISSPKFEILNSQNSEIYFVLKARNGEIILTSETYKNKAGALKGIESVRKNAINESNFEIRTSSDGRKYFVLKSGNRKVIGMSEMYNSLEKAKKGINSVQSVAKTQKVNFV
jgi:uncharacterized protein YegP (UPF0339 family)